MTDVKKPMATESTETTEIFLMPCYFSVLFRGFRGKNTCGSVGQVPVERLPGACRTWGKSGVAENTLTVSTANGQERNTSPIGTGWRLCPGHLGSLKGY